MIFSLEKTNELIARPPSPAGEHELRRDGAVFFIGTALPARPTLETVFDSDCLAPVELFYFRFADNQAFHQSEELVRMVKKNFKGYILGQFDATPSFALIENAYAAGIDLLILPLDGLAGPEAQKRLEALDYATTVFPRWATAASMVARAESSGTILTGIDALLERQVLPLVAVGVETSHLAAAEIGRIFEHLALGWRRRRATVKPFLPLLNLTAPIAPPPRRGLVGTLFDKVYDSHLRTSSDLRRLLRVRQVVESFESAGL